MAITSSYLSSLFNLGVAGGAADGLLGIALGNGAQPRAYSGADAIQGLRFAERNQAKQIAGTAQEPEVKRDIAAFRAGVAKAATTEKLLSDPAVMKVLLRANGLGDQEAYPALARKALLSDLADSKSLANRLTDRRWKAAARTYEFARKGMAVLRDPMVMDTLAHGYAEVTWRKSLDRTTPGLSDALTFRAQAAGVTSDLQILGDPILRRVVTTTLGLPLEIALQSLDAQQKAITTRLDIARLKDPKFVDNFTQRYLLAAAEKATRDAATTGTASLSVLSAGLVI